MDDNTILVYINGSEKYIPLTLKENATIKDVKTQTRKKQLSQGTTFNIFNDDNTNDNTSSATNGKYSNIIPWLLVVIIFVSICFSFRRFFFSKHLIGTILVIILFVSYAIVLYIDKQSNPTPDNYKGQGQTK